MNKDVKIIRFISIILIAIGSIGCIFSWIIFEINSPKMIKADVLCAVIFGAGTLLDVLMDQLESKRRARTWQLKRHSKTK